MLGAGDQAKISLLAGVERIDARVDFGGEVLGRQAALAQVALGPVAVQRLARAADRAQIDAQDLTGPTCQWRSKKGPLRRCKKGPLGGCGLVPVVHGRAPRATRRALNRLTRRRARE